MALINCPECGREISDKAESCPHCGYTILKYSDSNSRVDTYEIKLFDTRNRDKSMPIIKDFFNCSTEEANEIVNSPSKILARNLSKEETIKLAQEFTNNLIGVDAYCNGKLVSLGLKPEHLQNKNYSNEPLKKDNNLLMGKIAFGFILLCIISFIIIEVKTYNSNSKNRDTEAWVCAQDVVKNNLKSPSTADFPWYDDSYVTDLGNDNYKISSYVDAENSFGAEIREYFTVRLTLTKDGYKNASCSFK